MIMWVVCYDGMIEYEVYLDFGQEVMLRCEVLFLVFCFVGI